MMGDACSECKECKRIDTCKDKIDVRTIDDDDILNTLISRIIHHPKSVAISTIPASNLYMSETFKKVRKEVHDYIGAFGYNVKRIDLARKCYDEFQEMWEIRKEKTMRPRLRIKNVIFNDPATIVFWYDGTKTVVKCQEGDTFDPEKGLAMAICKKILGSNDSQSNFNDIFKKWLSKEEEKKEPEVLGRTKIMTITDKGLVMEVELTDPKFAATINETLGILGE